VSPRVWLELIIAGSLLGVIAVSSYRLAGFKAELADTQRIVAERENAIVRQNSEIEKMAANAKAINAEAASAARRVLLDGARRRLAAEQGATGWVALNKWMMETFGTRKKEERNVISQ